MTKDYAKYRVSPQTRRTKRQPAPQNTTSLPFVLMITLGLGAGLGFGAFWFNQHAKKENASETTTVQATDTKLRLAQKEDDVPPPRFEFYTLLPDMALEEASKTPKQATEPQVASRTTNTPTKVVSATLPAATEGSLATIENAIAPTQTALTIPAMEATSSSIQAQASNISPQPNQIQSPQTQVSTIAQDPLIQLAFIVQAGSFKNQAAAEKLKAKLAFQGMQSKIEPASSASGDLWYRVVLGPVPTQEDAKILQSKLEASENLNSLVLRVRV